ncbi:Coiled-coil domain-containing protein 90 [Cynara cardunculus var. scolymus]|uniref:Coiled-coil domain-containing protein 90 n=1 Tax=Cynara cardunculus var. scolymus TaxID=59895 RepID=A0A118K2C2_CYNCS|nr:Coiled-coil domain-containing protein 90 [Cynara cardunculus var. scolymus]
MSVGLRRFVQRGINSGFQVKSMKNNGFSNSLLVPNRCDYNFRRHLSQLVNPKGVRICLVDTLALVRRLEAQGVPSKQAEAITSAITEVLNDSLESVADTFTSNADMQKTVMLQEAHLSKFKSEVQSSQEHHFSSLQRETEKLRTDIDKMRSELRYEIDKEIHGLRAQVEAAKYDVIKYCIGTLISISAVGLAVIRILM